MMFELKGVFLLIGASVLFSNGAVVTRGETCNDRPIIGVLSQEPLSTVIDEYYTKNFTSYVAASYVKAIEGAGARVVPIMIGKGRKYYEDIVNKINGVLFPGGDASFNVSNGYADAGQYIFELAKQLNDNGEYFPLFGTCLGFQLLIILASGRGYPENKVSCRSVGNQPITFTDDYSSSKMFKNIDGEIAELLKNDDVTINHHHFCIIDENLKFKNLSKEWQVTSHSNDNDGLKFISSIENKRYPFFGVQFHPEKAAFEWKLANRDAHSYNAVKVNGYFMEFFVNECRKSSNNFGGESEENKNLIYNYKPYFTGAWGNNDFSYFNQCYFFEPIGE